MIIDCGQCTIRGAACATCAVTFVTEAGAGAPRGARGSGPAHAIGSGAGPAPARPRTPPPVPPGRLQGADGAAKSLVIELDAAETRALAALANAGLIPRLRYSPAVAKAS